LEPIIAVITDDELVRIALRSKSIDPDKVTPSRIVIDRRPNVGVILCLDFEQPNKDAPAR
jgi:hypothetical protein